MNAIIFVKIRTVIDLRIQNVTLFNYDGKLIWVHNANATI